MRLFPSSFQLVMPQVKCVTKLYWKTTKLIGLIHIPHRTLFFSTSADWVRMSDGSLSFLSCSRFLCFVCVSNWMSVIDVFACAYSHRRQTHHHKQYQRTSFRIQAARAISLVYPPTKIFVILSWHFVFPLLWTRTQLQLQATSIQFHNFYSNHFLAFQQPLHSVPFLIPFFPTSSFHFVLYWI